MRGRFPDQRRIMKVIRGMHNGDIVYVFSTENRNGFEIAGEMGLEGIRFGSSIAHFVEVWHTEVVIEAAITNRILREPPDDLILALIIEFAEDDNYGFDRQRATMQRRPRRRPSANRSAP
jgi:hypothetical protein